MGPLTVIDGYVINSDQNKYNLPLLHVRMLPGSNPIEVVINVVINAVIHVVINVEINVMINGVMNGVINV